MLSPIHVVMGVSQICDTLSELAGKIPDVDKTWPELLPFIFSCVQSGDPRLMEAALNVFAELARSMMTTLMQYMGTLHQVRAVHATTDAAFSPALAGPHRTPTTWPKSLELGSQRTK